MRNIDIIKNLPDEFDFNLKHSICKMTYHARKRQHDYLVTWDGGCKTYSKETMHRKIFENEFSLCPESITVVKSILLKKYHKDFIKDLCINLIGCGTCRECHPHISMASEIFDVSRTGFKMDPYDSKTNKKITKMASEFGYAAKIKTEWGETYIEIDGD